MAPRLRIRLRPKTVSQIASELLAKCLLAAEKRTPRVEPIRKAIPPGASRADLIKMIQSDEDQIAMLQSLRNVTIKAFTAAPRQAVEEAQKQKPKPDSDLAIQICLLKLVEGL